MTMSLRMAMRRGPAHGARHLPPERAHALRAAGPLCVAEPATSGGVLAARSLPTGGGGWRAARARAHALLAASSGNNRCATGLEGRGAEGARVRAGHARRWAGGARRWVEVAGALDRA